jgi:UrcA family protein
VRPTLPAAVTASVLALACVSPALAAEPQTSVAVRYGDLNTAVPAGVETLLRRVDQATLVVCGGRPDLRDIAAVGRFKTCRAQAREQAIAQTGSSLAVTLANHPAGR